MGRALNRTIYYCALHRILYYQNSTTSSIFSPLKFDQITKKIISTTSSIFSPPLKFDHFIEFYTIRIRQLHRFSAPWNSTTSSIFSPLKFDQITKNIILTTSSNYQKNYFDHFTDFQPSEIRALPRVVMC